MPPLRLTLADLPADQRLLLHPAGAGTADAQSAPDGAGTDRQATALRGRGKGKGRGAARFRLKAPEAPESAILSAVLKRLRLHPKVHWVERMNSGAGQLKFADGGASQWIRFGWRGAPDIVGQLKAEYGGVILCVECKTRTGRLRPEQEMFLNQVRCGGGVAFVARSQDDVEEFLG